MRDQELVWSEGLGLADIASGRRPDEHTLYQVASISGPGHGLLQLRDDGRLGLDDPIVRHLPECAAITHRHGTAEHTTFRRLLSHRAGFRYSRLVAAGA